MRRSLLSLAVLATLIVISVTSVFAQTVNVTFMINSATAPDTINASSSVTVTGNKAALTSFGAGVAATNIGGDYWTATVPFTQGDTLSYKFRVSGGWENNSTNADGIGSITDNRTMIVGASDTTLPLQFVNFTGNTQLQYWKPWSAVADTFINIFFRVDMQGFAGFNKATDTVGVRGDKKNGSFGSTYFSWGTSAYMTKENNSGLSYDGTNFWSGRVQLEKSKINAGDSVEYKFIVNNDWGKADFNNRGFTIPVAKADTTLHWVWFQDTPVISRVNPDSVVVTFRTDLTTAIQKGSFAGGDTVYVEAGYYATADSTRRTAPLVKQGLTNFYQATMTLFTKVGAPLDYQYYRTKFPNSDVRENYYNFDYTGGNASEQEKRQLIVPAGTNLTIRDTVGNSIASARRQPYFPNQRNLTQAVAVKWVVDMRPAYYQIWAGDSLQGIQGTITVSKADSIKPYGVAINGPATGGWATWNAIMVADTNSLHKMWDDGTHGDVTANDTMYTITLNFPTSYTVGEVFKYGLRGGDNEAGNSGFGLNHLENIDDTNPTFTLHTQWGSINPKFYAAWDYNNERPATPSGVYTPLTGLPLTYDLYQNYPNPFNPTTKIVYDLPIESVVGLRVYNLLGQVVATLTDGKQTSGRHTVTFDASRFTSGVYFYQITAGNFVSVKKMVLVK